MIGKCIVFYLIEGLRKMAPDAILGVFIKILKAIAPPRLNPVT